LKEKEIKKINLLAVSFPWVFTQGEKDFGHIVLGVGLVSIPILLYLYAERTFWKIIEIKNNFLIKNISKTESVIFPDGASCSDKDGCPQDTRESDGNSFQDTPGNFIFLAYSVDSQLKLIRSEIERGKGGFLEKGKNVDAEKIIRNNVLTKNGRKKIEFICWLRGMVERGVADHLSKKTLRVGVCLAWELHQELNAYLRQMS
jgi:hypothetical protein